MSNGTPGKILIIDDDPDIQDIYNEVLKQAGYIVDHADDGTKGLGKIIEGGYDLILLDIMLPKIDGMNILKKVHNSPPSSYNGPIIVLSQIDQQDIINNALQLGAKGYIVKSSITPDQLIDRVSQILQTK